MKAKILEYRSNAGNCDDDWEYWNRKCRGRIWKSCDYEIPSIQIKELYEGNCFSRLVWKCPKCGAVNTNYYKVGFFWRVYSNISDSNEGIIWNFGST